MNMSTVTKFNAPEEFKSFCKKLETTQKEAIVELAKAQGITWKENDLWKIQWMRCAMAIGSFLKKGKIFEINFEATFKTSTPKAPKAPKAKAEVKKEVKIVPERFHFKKIIEKFGNTFAEDNGDIVIGEGYKEVLNRFGKMEAAQGYVRMETVEYIEAWNQSFWVLLESAFADKEKIKEVKGRFNDFNKKWYVPFGNILNFFKKFKNIVVSSVIAPVITKVMDKVNIDRIDMDTMKYSMEVENYTYSKPEGMGDVTLFKHQEATVEFLISHKRVTAGLAVGLGKTLSSITAAKELLNRGTIKRFLVVAPSSVKYNWKSEIEKFGKEKVVVLNSEDLRKAKADKIWAEAEEATFIVVNYDMIRKTEKDADGKATYPIAEKLKELCPDAVIADEAHKLKNWKALTTKAFLQFWGKAEYLWFLTATPYPNGAPREAYTMLSHLRPDLTGKWFEFKNNFVETEWVNAGKLGTIEKPVKLQNLDELKELMKHVVIIRTHKSPDVTSSLPKDRHLSYKLDMEPWQKKLYKAMAENLSNELDKISNGSITAPVNVLAMMKRLEQVAIDPDMLNPEKAEMDKLYPKEEWAVNTILSHLEDSENRGIVLFADMKLPLEKIAYALINEGMSSDEIAFITGEIKNEERFKVQEAFSQGLVKVVLCTSAAEEGVNLQKGAHTMIHLDVPWVPKSVTQREGRILRQGQPNEFSIFHTPVMGGTVEDNKRNKLASKVSVIESLLGENSAGSARNNVQSDLTAMKLTIDDIRSILSMDAN